MYLHFWCTSRLSCHNLRAPLQIYYNVPHLGSFVLIIDCEKSQNSQSTSPNPASLTLAVMYWSGAVYIKGLE